MPSEKWFSDLAEAVYDRVVELGGEIEIDGRIYIRRAIFRQAVLETLDLFLVANDLTAPLRRKLRERLDEILPPASLN